MESEAGPMEGHHAGACASKQIHRHMIVYVGNNMFHCLVCIAAGFAAYCESLITANEISRRAATNA